jgi:hypothetical protein
VGAPKSEVRGQRATPGSGRHQRRGERRGDDRGLGGERAGRREDVLPVDGDGGVLGHLLAAGVVGEQRGERGAGGSGLGMAQDSARAHDERDLALSAARECVSHQRGGTWSAGREPPGDLTLRSRRTA